MIVIDASVWVSYYLSQDSNHTASRIWLNAQLANQQILLDPELVMPEVSGAISRRVGETEARQAWSDLQNRQTLTLFDLDRDLSKNATELAIRLKLRGADAVYVALAERLGVPLVTWDQEIINRTAQLIQAQTP